MTKIEDLIGNLLMRHNCVIVPSFGGFVAKPVSAKINFKTGEMIPPTKSLLFNRQLINNDGLLINELAQANAISFDVAQAEVTNLVNSWKSVLAEGNRVEIERIGILYQDSEKNLCFEQDRFVNLLMSSYGLQKVHFLSDEDVKIIEAREEVKTREVVIEQPVETKIVPITAAVKEEKPSIVEEASVELPEKRKRSGWRYIAAACLLPIAFYSVWIPMKTDVLESGVFSLNDFNPFYSAEKGSYETPEISPVVEEAEVTSLEDQIEALPETTDTYSYKVSSEKYLVVDLPSNETEVVNNETVEQPIQVNAMNYIVGCFGVKENADNLVATLKAQGFDAHIHDYHNGLHRVSAGSALSMEALAEIKVAANQIDLAGWVLK